MRLFILGQEIELKDDGKLAQTKQVNDIFSLSTRQANYTNSFSIPRTAKNIRTFQDLGIIGNDSNVPYQKNTASLFNDAGECFVFEGWAIISETAKDFKCNIYDGNLEIYKAIENLTISDLDISDLSHEKTLASVVATFDDSKPYKYIIADYNGKCVYDTNKINVDFLVPSVRTSYLVEQIEAKTGMMLNGSFKSNPDYLNRWMTYPKGTPSENAKSEVYKSGSVVLNNTTLTGLSPTVTSPVITTANGKDFTVTKEVFLEIEVKTNFAFFEVKFPSIQPCNGSLKMIVNGVTSTVGVISGETTTLVKRQMNINDVFSFFVQNDITPRPATISGSFVSLTVSERLSILIDFVTELSGITVKDFLNEIIWEFGLTLFKEKYSNDYTLKTLSEIINLENAVDWSDKFVSIESERYAFLAYAQMNYFRRQYTDSKASFNDGRLILQNANLADKKTVVQSKMFSPEFSSSGNLGYVSRVYKLWDKETKDNSTVTYKPKTNNFYLLRSIDKTFPIDSVIGSEMAATSTALTVAPVQSYTGLSYQEIVDKNYLDIKLLLNKSKVITLSVNLKDSDVSDVDFSKPYFFKSLGAYFLLNKISNFIPNKETKIEVVFIKLEDMTLAHSLTGDYSALDYSNNYYLT